MELPEVKRDYSPRNLQSQWLKLKPDQRERPNLLATILGNKIFYYKLYLIAMEGLHKRVNYLKQAAQEQERSFPKQARLLLELQMEESPS